MSLSKPTGTQENIFLKTNVFFHAHDTIPLYFYGSKIEIEFPVYPINALPHNHPLTAIKTYVENQKTYVQNYLNEKNRNENRNFKNSMYIPDSAGIQVSNAGTTLHQYPSIYTNETIRAEDKAAFLAKIETEKQLQKENKFHDFLKKTNSLARASHFNKLKKQREIEQTYVKLMKRYLIQDFI